jgi:anti-sigma-K factor RskA
MSGGRNHRRWRADLAAYLLGSLEAEEVEAMEEHLQGCERCREELRWLRPAVDVLPESVPQLDPPPGLKARLMAEVRSDVAQAEAPAAGWEARRAAEPPRRRRRGFRGFVWRPAAALTALALVVAVVVGYAVGTGGGGGPGTTTTKTVAQGGAVHATLEKSGDSGTLMLTGLEQARTGHVYETWVQHGNRAPVPSSLFEPRRDGTASTAIPHQLEGADRVMVSVEPEGGSDQPTSSPIVTLELSG